MPEFAKVRNKSGEARFIPALNVVVEKDEVFDVPEPLLAGLTSSPIWELVTDAPTAKKAAVKE